MSQKQQFRYRSSDHVHQINGLRWLPDQKPYRGIVQIIHGMVEFVDRYDTFARFLCDNGYVVVGEDHLGHGGSVSDPSEWGYFGASNGFEHIIQDIRKLHQRQISELGQLPYFILGHSMGSFLARIYITRYGEELSGAIIMGTGSQPGAVAGLGWVLASVIALFKGDKYRSTLINGMALGSYNKAFEPARTPADWLTRDNAIVDAYLKEPRDTFVFTVGAYKELFKGLIFLSRKSTPHKVPKTLPLLLTSGARDPVGAFGKGVYKVYDSLKAAGIDDVSLKLYDDCRHEILNELNKTTVFKDLLNWIQGYTKTGSAV